MRLAVRDAVAEVLGADALTDASDLARFRPHVSVAYSNRGQRARPIVKALADLAPAPHPVTLHHIDLLEYHRDHRMYGWTSATPLAIGEVGAQASGSSHGAGTGK